MIFELDNVELYFKNKRILNGIYLKAETGSITGILGSNGSGKSCLLEILFGNLKSKYKQIRIDNETYSEPLFQSKLVKYLPQYHFIPGRMKLKVAFKLYHVDWDVFISRFANFSVYKSFRITKLSDGERRLIEAYLILKSESELILLDEPFSHLSPKHIEAVKLLIKEASMTKAVIVTDHRYEHIIEITDSIYLLKNGCTKLIDNLKELEDYKYLNEGSLD